jgi:16S rRNA (cytosine1402-N4)-methyltransferase
MGFHHVSVLLAETISRVLTDPHGIYVDGTLGGGGHSLALSEKLAPDAMLIGFDRDEEAIAAAKERLAHATCPFLAIHENFSRIGEILDEKGIGPVSGFLFDLGVSSYQLDEAERGFSYMQEGRLDMRMDRRNLFSAYDVVNGYSAEELEKVIRDYGEERWAKRIAEFIAKAAAEKHLETTTDLVRVIKAAIPAGAREDGPHPAKRTFQAIRIEVNGELRILEKTMQDCVRHLKPGGRLAVITFHSLEDRIIKNVFRDMAKDCICPPELPVCLCGHRREVKLMGKAIRPTAAEVEANPRARSATLRVVEKV